MRNICRHVRCVILSDRQITMFELRIPDHFKMGVNDKSHNGRLIAVYRSPKRGAKRCSSTSSFLLHESRNTHLSFGRPLGLYSN